LSDGAAFHLSLERGAFFFTLAQSLEIICPLLVPTIAFVGLRLLKSRVLLLLHSPLPHFFFASFLFLILGSILSKPKLLCFISQRGELFFPFRILLPLVKSQVIVFSSRPVPGQQKKVVTLSCHNYVPIPCRIPNIFPRRPYFSRERIYFVDLKGFVFSYPTWSSRWSLVWLRITWWQSSSRSLTFLNPLPAFSLFPLPSFPVSPVCRKLDAVPLPFRRQRVPPFYDSRPSSVPILHFQNFRLLFPFPTFDDHGSDTPPQWMSYAAFISSTISHIFLSFSVPHFMRLRFLFSFSRLVPSFAFFGFL